MCQNKSSFKVCRHARLTHPFNVSPTSPPLPAKDSFFFPFFSFLSDPVVCNQLVFNHSNNSAILITLKTHHWKIKSNVALRIWLCCGLPALKTLMFLIYGASSAETVIKRLIKQSQANWGKVGNMISLLNTGSLHCLSRTN